MFDIVDNGDNADDVEMQALKQIVNSYHKDNVSQTKISSYKVSSL